MNNYRATIWLSLVLLVSVGTGCIGQRNAVKSQTELRTATTTAILTANSLKAATAAELQAHLQTRETLREVIGQWQKSRPTAATLPVIEAKDAALLKLQTMFSATLQEFQAFRHEANANLTPTINRQQAPLTGQVDSAKKAATEAATETAKYPNDLKLSLTSVQADLLFNSIAAKVNTEEIKTRINYLNTCDAAETKLMADSIHAVETQRQTIQTAFNQAINTLNTVTLPNVNMGSEPAANTAALDGLIKYAETVQLTTEAMDDYLQSNSLGKGSFFYGALKAFGKGVLTAIPIVGTGQGATLQEVKDSGGALLQATQDQFKQTAQTATESARTALKETLDDAKSNVNHFIESKLAQAIGPGAP